jgi:hypothetical protein
MLSPNYSQDTISVSATDTAPPSWAEVSDSAGNRCRKCISAYHFHVSTSVVFLS